MAEKQKALCREQSKKCSQLLNMCGKNKGNEIYDESDQKRQSARKILNLIS